MSPLLLSLLFFFNDTATTEIYTLSLHDALPISALEITPPTRCSGFFINTQITHQYFDILLGHFNARSEEHTSELQSHSDLVCRLLLEKKNENIQKYIPQVRIPNTPIIPAIDIPTRTPIDME